MKNKIFVLGLLFLFVFISDISDINAANNINNLVSCSDGLRYEFGGYALPRDVPFRVDKKVITVKEINAGNLLKDIQPSATIVVSDVLNDGILLNSIQKTISRGNKAIVNGLELWVTDIYFSSKGTGSTVPLLVREINLANPFVCDNFGVYNIGSGDYMNINSKIIVAPKVVGTTITFSVEDLAGKAVFQDAKIGSEFDVKGLHIKVEDIKTTYARGNPHTLATLVITKSIYYTANLIGYQYINKQNIF